MSPPVTTVSGNALYINDGAGHFTEEADCTRGKPWRLAGCLS